MNDQRFQPRLRLVGTDNLSADVQAPLEQWAERRRAELDVATENQAASMSARDPRWVLAARAYGQLEGAVMTPERRDRVMRTATTLGVRPFDANLIIAIVQDRARRGESLAEAKGALELVPKPALHAEDKTGWQWFWHWTFAISGGVLLGMVMIKWILGGA